MKNYKSDLPCITCGDQGEDRTCFHHIKTRGSGGSDNEWNLMSLCQKHHNEIHQKGTPHFVGKYYKAELWMIANGWLFDEYLRKWTHEKE